MRHALDNAGEGGGGHEELEGPADLDGGQDQGEQGEDMNRAP